MSEPQAQQPALAGLAPRKRRKAVTHTPATVNPIVQVVLDVQATHLGQTFDYLIDEKFSETAQPGVMVRVRFGGRRVNGIIWARVAKSHTAASALRYIERVMTPDVLVSGSMRRDITAIAEAYGGTRANILRLAVPPRVAKVDKEQHLAMSGTWVGSRGRVRLDKGELERGSQRMRASYDQAVAVENALRGGGFTSFVVDALPGVGRWADDLAYMASLSLDSGRTAVLVLPTMREVNDVAVALRRFGLKPFRQINAANGGFEGDFDLLSAAMAPSERYRSYLAAASGQVRCVIGTRAAMYAPVEGPGLFAILEDAAYQNADGMMPYAAARGVLRLRAKLHGGTFMAIANARSVISEWEVSADFGRMNEVAPDGDPSLDSSRMNNTADSESSSRFDSAQTSGNAIADMTKTIGNADDVVDAAENRFANVEVTDANMSAFVSDTAKNVIAKGNATGDEEASIATDSSLASAQTQHEPILETGEMYPLGASHAKYPINGEETSTQAKADDAIFSVVPTYRVEVCETPVSGFSTAVHPLPAVVQEASPWIRWLNLDELARLTDPSIGARVPHTAVRVLSEALENGPILFSIPHDGIAEVLSCSHCHQQARCPRCTGPLQQVRAGAPRCRWCGAPASNWSCPNCHCKHMSVVRVGAAGTAAQLQHLFRDIPMVLSSPSQPNGIVEWVPDRPLIVIATPEAEPHVKAGDGKAGHYQAVAILDAWTSLYAPGVDARVDALTAWMRAASMCACREDGGQVLLIGETDPIIAQSLIQWDSRILAADELDERAETGLSPVFAVACVWGRRDAVMTTLERIGALTGDWSQIKTEVGEFPAVLGPVPIAQPKTVDARELEATHDRVKAVVRVPQRLRAELAQRLHSEVARHVATRAPGELRFQLDPKDLI
ncbi:primosomal protein N' [Bifidobacterium sp. ESL0745]|uniref:primosomal protein N' n=1 Tax=Bifidobacterium sp. ESL0745 TaxID=2983226 RepID=UPI0023F6FB2B|nr:primosomal protein N' [Bifidobacterium sp. ESL0745]MDF7664895.1 primosomal protein N' [Bifidobacterium sp. ESL0745]